MSDALSATSLTKSLLSREQARGDYKPDLLDALNLVSKPLVLPRDAQLDSHIISLNSQLLKPDTHLEQ